MAKKIWYSTPLRFYWNKVYSIQKKITPDFTDEQIINALRYQNANAPFEKDESLENRETFLRGLEMWWADNNRNLLHIFFREKRLQDFLINLPLADLEGIKKYLFENGENQNIVYIKTGAKTECVTYCYGIHIPYETEGYAFQFNIYQDETFELFYFFDELCGGITDKIYLDLLKKNDKESLFLTKIFRLALNTIAYMKCFPECVIDGVPRITVERNENRTDNNVVFEISEKIIDLELSGKTIMPHFRKGHFRLLHSDYYTKKKGELVFVRETMVNGKAKTVYTTDNINGITSLNDTI